MGVSLSLALFVSMWWPGLQVYMLWYDQNSVDQYKFKNALQVLD